MMTDGWPNGRWIRDTMDEGDGRETLARRRNRERRGADGLVMVVVSSWCLMLCRREEK